MSFRGSFTRLSILLFSLFVSVIWFFLVSAFGAFPAAMPLHGATHSDTAPGIAGFRPLRDRDRRKPLDGARGGLLGSSLVLEPTDDEAV